MKATDLRFASALVYRRVEDLHRTLREKCLSRGLKGWDFVLLRIIGCGRSQLGAEEALNNLVSRAASRDDGREMLEEFTLVVSYIPEVEQMSKTEIVRAFKKNLRYGRQHSRLGAL